MNCELSVLNKLIQPPNALPPHFCSSETCNSLMLFWTTKISNIHQQLRSNVVSTPSPEPFLLFEPFSTFHLPDLSDISEFICKSKPATCHLDPMPTGLVKSCLSSLLPLISAIIHSSLTTGIVPSLFKTALVTPILKKPSLDPNNFNNLRPISNLPIIYKILEKVVAAQLHLHLVNNNIYERFQSGFRSCHSTETALLKVTNDLLIGADSGLLTISHSVLLSRLSSLGISDTPLAWFQSYLLDRSQFIQLRSFHSRLFPSPLVYPKAQF